MQQFPRESTRRGRELERQRETERQRGELETHMRNTLTAAASGNPEKKRYVNLCTQEFLGIWVDEVQLGLDPYVARSMVEDSLRNEIAPLIKETKISNIDRLLVSLMTGVAEQMRLAREMTENPPEESSEEKEARMQRERDDDVERQIRDDKTKFRHDLNNNMSRKGPKGGHYTRIIGKV